ncbi:MAG: DNA-binding protein, partial [Candidatus Latescibacteria bacterium]|nr:DNA-binding protein [Candidatus Latescibacterota bacterium]
SYLVARPSRDVIVLGHQEVTRDWWATARSEYDLYVSQLVLDEISAGDPGLAAARQSLVQDLPLLNLTDAVEALALEYAQELPIPQKVLTDAYHLAFAVAYEIDYLLTWNCAHLANGTIRLRLQRLNTLRGRHLPVIVTPEELMPESDT